MVGVSLCVLMAGQSASAEIQVTNTQFKASAPCDVDAYIYATTDTSYSITGSEIDSPTGNYRLDAGQIRLEEISLQPNQAIDLQIQGDNTRDSSNSESLILNLTTGDQLIDAITKHAEYLTRNMVMLNLIARTLSLLNAENDYIIGTERLNVTYNGWQTGDGIYAAAVILKYFSCDIETLFTLRAPNQPSATTGFFASSTTALTTLLAASGSIFKVESNLAAKSLKEIRLPVVGATNGHCGDDASTLIQGARIMFFDSESAVVGLTPVASATIPLTAMNFSNGGIVNGCQTSDLTITKDISIPPSLRGLTFFIGIEFLVPYDLKTTPAIYTLLGTQVQGIDDYWWHYLPNLRTIYSLESFMLGSRTLATNGFIASSNEAATLTNVIPQGI